MTAVELIQYITRAFFGLTFRFAASDLMRYRDRSRLDITLMLGALGLPVMIQALPADVRGVRAVSLISSVALVAQPYLVMRLVQYFRPVPPPLMGAVVGGMVASWAIVFVDTPPLRPQLSLAIIAYFVVVEAIATAVFLRSMPSTGGSFRWRLGLAGAGTALLAMVFLLAGIGVARPSLSADLRLSTVLSVVPVLAGLAYFLGFVPPTWLRQAWQVPDLYRYLRTVGEASAEDRSKLAAQELSRATTRITGGLGSAVALWDGEVRRLRIEATDLPQLAAETLSSNEGLARGPSGQGREACGFQPGRPAAGVQGRRRVHFRRAHRGRGAHVGRAAGLSPAGAAILTGYAHAAPQQSIRHDAG